MEDRKMLNIKTENIKLENVEFVVDCGCYQAVPESAVDGDCAICPECKEVAQIVYFCKECAEEDGSCVCEDRAYFVEQAKYWKPLYDGEVTAGIHIPMGGE
jgi:hypothetical protein